MSQPAQPPMVADSLPTVPPPPPIQVGSGGSSGGYYFEPDQVQSVINKWQQLLDDLTLDRNNAKRVHDVKAPAADPASHQFVSSGSDPSGQTLLTQHQRMVDYVRNYIDALQKASGNIQQSDEETQRKVNQSAQGGL